MLPKTRRIPRSLFSGILASSHRVYSTHFILQISHISVPQARLAASVSKKVSKKATARNTLRRRMYSVVSSLLSTLSPSLYLLSAKPGAEKLSLKEISEELAVLFEKR